MARYTITLEEYITIGVNDIKGKTLMTKEYPNKLQAIRASVPVINEWQATPMCNGLLEYRVYLNKLDRFGNIKKSLRLG